VLRYEACAYASRAAEAKDDRGVLENSILAKELLQQAPIFVPKSLNPRLVQFIYLFVGENQAVQSG
jgi:hypothetical protein